MSKLEEWANGRATDDYEAARILEGALWLLKELEAWCNQPCDADQREWGERRAEQLLDYAKILCGKGKV